MTPEERYSAEKGGAYLKKFGQYFTPLPVAEVMVGWACAGAETMLDPAAGNSVFLREARRQYPGCRLTGWELDPGMPEFFGRPDGAELRMGDYLTGDWSARYDAIVCNPPYARFQNVTNRGEVLAALERHTGVRYSGAANLYVLFLLKSIHQLSERGRLAYLIPSEFLNSRYGAAVKALLLERRLLRALISFEEERSLFPNAVTTCCLLLLDREEKDSAAFCTLARPGAAPCLCRRIPLEELDPADKWGRFFRPESGRKGAGLRPLSDICTVTRGIATGANEFYCFSRSKIRETGIDPACFTPCISRSALVTGPVFRQEDFDRLDRADRPVWLLDVDRADSGPLEAYVESGRAEGVDLRYLPARRTPWYSVERKPAAPIWISSACRGGIKVVRNLAGVSHLTTFHGIFMKPGREGGTELLFCTLLAPAVQKLLLENRKLLGSGLAKFQPGDLNGALTVDPERLTRGDREALLACLDRLKAGEKVGPLLDRILLPYIEP